MLKTPKTTRYPILHSVCAAAGNIALAMGLFMACRLIFWALNADLFPDLELTQMPLILAGGLYFDIAAVAYGNALWLLMLWLPAKFRYRARCQTAHKAVFVTFNAVMLAANCLDFVYFRYTLRRTTMGFVAEFAGSQHFGQFLGGWIVGDYWYVFLIWGAMIAALILGYRKARQPEFAAGTRANIAYYAGSAAALVCTAALCVMAMRGGVVNARPLAPNHAAQFVKHPLEASIVQNTPFCILRTKSSGTLKALHFFDTEKELEQHYTPLIVPHPSGDFIPKNVVVIIWESLNKENVGALNSHLDGGAYTGYTPFLDSLLRHSLTFARTYANGRKSIDGVPSVAMSVPSVSDVPFVYTPYSVNQINALPSLLKEKGYSSAFFHGCFNGSMRIDECAFMAHFQKYYGKTEYNNDSDYDGGWGIYDEEFLQFFAQKLGEMPQPFCAAVFTQSSHGPFKIPARYSNRWTQCPDPYTRSISYVDFALRRFFETAGKQAWYDNTIFVITADHAVTPRRPEYQTCVGQMEVPIIYFAPDGSLGGTRQGVTQQSDIMPTILGILNYDKPFVAFGRNALDERDTMGVAITYVGGAYLVLYNDYVLIHDGERPTGFYDLHTDKMLKHNILDPAPPPLQLIVKTLDLKLKAFLQQYNSRMLQNRMTAD